MCQQSLWKICFVCSYLGCTVDQNCLRSLLSKCHYYRYCHRSTTASVPKHVKSGQVPEGMKMKIVYRDNAQKQERNPKSTCMSTHQCQDFLQQLWVAGSCSRACRLWALSVKASSSSPSQTSNITCNAQIWYNIVCTPTPSNNLYLDIIIV